MFIFLKNDLKAWWDSPHFSKMRLKSKWLSWVSKGLLWEAVNKLSHIYKASPVFTSLYKSSCFSKFSAGSTCISLATSEFYILSPCPCSHIFSASSPCPPLLCLEVPWPFVLIEHPDHSGEGTGVGVKKQAMVEWCYLVDVNLDKWLTTFSFSFRIHYVELLISASLQYWEEGLKGKLEKPLMQYLAHTATQ